MNDREFRQHLIKLRLRERKKAQDANAAVKKPPATAKSQKAKKRRSAYAGVTQNLGFETILDWKILFRSTRGPFGQRNSLQWCGTVSWRVRRRSQPRAYGMDVGWNPTAVVWGARDPASGVVYLYSEHYRGQGEPASHVEAIRARGEWILG